MWGKFVQFHLTENMRLIGRGEDERSFAEYLLRVGNGTEPSVDSNSSDASSAETKIAIPQQFMSLAKSDLEFVREIFPNLSSIVTEGLADNDTSWHAWLCERAIICPTNADVSKINKLVIDDFPGELRTHKSHDKCRNDEQVCVYNFMLLESCIIYGSFFSETRFC